MLSGCTGGGKDDSKAENSSQLSSESSAESSAQDSGSSGTGSEDEDSGGAAKTGDITGDISVMLFDRGNVPEGENSITDNRWTNWVQEEMSKQGINVTFVPVPRSEEAQKVPVMMASGTAADIMLIYNSALVHSFYEDGGTYDLAPYMDLAPNLVDYLGEECLSFGRNEKGEQWSIPARRSTTAQTNAFIRKDWLDTLGLEIPTTVDELYEAFTQFKEKDPGGVGAQNIVCYTGNGQPLARAFMKNVNNDLDYLTATSGLEICSDEGYIDYVKFRNKMYNEGLMDPEYFTSKNFSQKEKELCVAGQLGYWEYDVNGNVDNLRGGLLQNLKQNIPQAEFVSMVPIKNVHYDDVYNISYPIIGASLFVPKTAKNPEAVMVYLDFLAGNGGFTLFHGIEGEHFEYQDNVPVVLDPEHNANTKDWIRHDLFLVGNQGYYKTEEEFIAATAKELPGWENYVIDNYENAMAGIRLPSIDYISPTQTEQHANISKVNDDYLVRVTTCKPEEVDAIIAEWISELEKYDADTILQERREYFESIGY